MEFLVSPRQNAGTCYNGLMKFLIIFLSMTHVWAYGPQDIKLSDYEFKRYIRPQLISITQDYKNIIISMNPELKIFKPVFEELASLQEMIQSHSEKDFLKMNGEFSEMKKRIHKILSLLENSSYDKQKNHFQARNQLLSYQHFFKLRSSVFNFLTELETYSQILSAGAKLYSPKILIEKFYEIEKRFHIFLIYSSDNRFQKDFLNFWNTFMKPIGQRIIPYFDQDLFVRHLNDFNLTLNFLNVVLTKRNKPISSQSLTLLKIFHNRWVNILKVTLR